MNTAISSIEGRNMFPIPPSDEVIECPYCGKHPDEIWEYVEPSVNEKVSPVQYVKLNEGTYCQYTGCFVCSSCYVNIGTPTIEKLHIAFPYFRMDVAPIEGQNNEALVKFRLG